MREGFTISLRDESFALWTKPLGEVHKSKISARSYLCHILSIFRTDTFVVHSETEKMLMLMRQKA